MSLVLHFHPLSSFCHKALIALYENATPFVPHLVDFGAQDVRSRHLDLWPLGKIPVLKDKERGVVLPETTIILEYLDRHYPGPVRLLPDDADAALDVRLWDRLFNSYVHAPMQKIVLDRLRPADKRDPLGVEEARTLLHLAYGMIDTHMAGRAWAAGDAFSLADCAAVPALFYAGILEPFDAMPALAAYFDRLVARPSVTRVLAEARPWFDHYRYRDSIPSRFL